MKRLVMFAAAAAVASSAGVAFAKDRPRLLVVNLVNEGGLPDGVVRLLNEFTMSEFVKTGDYEVIGGSDVEAMIKMTERHQMMGCKDTACLAEIGGALGVDFMASTSVGKIGEYYLYNVKLIDVKRAEPIARWSEQVEGIESSLMAAVKRSIQTVANPDGEPPPPEEEKVAAAAEPVMPPRAEVVDDRLLGIGWAPLALWGAGFVSAIIAISLSVETDNLAKLASNRSQPGSQAAAAAGPGMQTGANVAWALTGITAAAGFIVWLVTGPDDSSPTVAPSANGAALHWSF